MSALLPSSWAFSEIGSLCDLKNGRAFKPTEWSLEGLKIVRIQNLNNQNALFNRYSGEYEEKYFLKGGELLFAWSGTPGTSFGAHVWRGGEALLNQHIFRVDFDDSFLDRRLFRHAINQKLNDLIGKAHGGAGLQHVTKGKFEATQIVVPPRNEQRRIADKLDTILTRVDALNDRLARITPLLKRFRQSVLAAANSGRLTEDWRSTAGKIALWNATKFGAVMLDLRYGTSKKCEVGSNGTAVLRIPNVGDAGIPDLTDLKFAEFEHAELNKLALRKGDILVIRSNGSVDLVGKACVVDERSEGLLFAGYLMRMRLDIGKAIPKFAYYVLSSPALRAQIELTAKSTSGVNNINSEELRSLPLPLPSVEEQTEIVRRVEILFAYAERLEARLQTARTAADRLTPALLAKAFRGELVPQDPNDEPATELLRRLREARAAEVPAKKPRGRKAATA
ncbi:restriction endonuclease subunit S [Comamonas testosteroni]|uniref:restriction endonuclease subunit S n=1 Tax=Comamonas testosteroni TaxID=285 RepID=UPI0009B920D3|nr:restriction endonuclease subunit S [Comamonas testosteroni]